MARLPEPVLVLELDSAGRLLLQMANPAAVRWLGLPQAPAAGGILDDLISPALREEMRAKAQPAITNGERATWRSAAFTDRPYQLTLDPLPHARWMLVARETTAHPQAAFRLDLLEGALDQVREAVYLADRESRFHYVNAEACRALGYSRDELLTMDVGDIDPDWPAERASANWDELKRVGSMTIRSAQRRKDGTRFPVEITCSHVQFGGEEYVICLVRDITERLRMEQQLHARAEEFRALVENSPNVVIRYDRDCRRIYANPAFLRLSGKAPEAILGRRPGDDTPVLSAPPLYESILRKVLETGEPQALVFNGRDAQGEFFWSQVRFVAEHDIDGRITNVLVIGNDVTALKTAELQWRTLVENLPSMVARFTPDGRPLFANPNVLTTFGVTMDRAIGHTAPVTDNHGRALIDIVREVAATGSPNLTEVTWKTPTATRHYSVRHVPERDESGKVRSVLGIASEITDLIETQQALQTERAIFMRGPTVVFKWKAAAGWPVEYVSPNVLAQFGYAPEDFTSGRVAYASLVHPDDVQRVIAEVDSGSSRDESFAQTYRLRHADGSYRVVQDFTSVIRSAEGKVTEFYGYVIDVTEFKQSGERLRLLNFALDNVREEAYLIDEEANFQYVNEGACRALGYTRDELLGMKLETIDPDFAGERWHEHWQALRDRRALIFEGRHRARNGSLYPVEISANYFEYQGRGYNLALARDISERREAELAMNRLNRALKTLSSGNEALVRATDENQLLAEMCRVLVDVGRYPLAWIGLPGADGALTPMAWAGPEAGFLAVLQRDNHEDPAAAAARTGEAQVVLDLGAAVTDETFQEEVRRRKLRACAAFPLPIGNDQIGALAIYAADAKAFDLEEAMLLAEMANDLAYGIRSLHARTDRERFMERLRASMQSTIQALSNTVELRDPYTAGHQRRVAHLAAAVARALGWTDERVQVMYLTGLVHDIGKVAVPSEILSKPGRLSLPELALVRTHADAGYEILKGVAFPWPLAEYVHQHHERLDGSGYPQGLSGDAISQEARVLAVCDVVEAMTTHRPYRPGLGLDAALEEIQRHRGVLFDAAVVDMCIDVIRHQGFEFE